MLNIELAHQVIQELVNTGVREFVLCAGARNSPLVYVLNENQSEHIKIYNCFEERSAAFFALGRIACTRRPVAIITTSGTAVAELLPAAVEATYSALPLILVTADRPKIFRGSGAPQSIDQVGLFSYYIEVALDIDKENSHISFRNLSWKKPIHVNICFDEPLIDGPVPKLDFENVVERTRLPEQEQMNMLREVDEFLRNHHPVVILGFVPDRAQETLLAFLENYQAPVFAESISSLRGHPRLKALTLRSGEKMISRLLTQGICDSVLRIGGVPTLRFWRDLEEKHRHLPVMSVSYAHFTGLSRPVQHFTDMGILKEFKGVERNPLSPETLIADSERSRQLQTLLERYPRSEPAMISQLSRSLKDQNLYLGNSLPIREWDLTASYDHPPARVVGNRGANGIDGQISSFLGWSRPDNENFCLIGDLTAMYDLVSLWIVPQLEKLKLRIVIINNKGGHIFKKMFAPEIFQNPHDISFKSWAEMWKWNYLEWTRIPEKLELADHQIIEILPDAAQTDAFWKEWDSLWIE